MVVHLYHEFNSNVNSKKMKQLCMSLVQCETEEELIDILQKKQLWDEHNWKLFGDDENNFSIIGNQQSKPESALVEKLVNSVDAMLMGECLSRGIVADSNDAPPTNKDALSTFFYTILTFFESKTILTVDCTLPP